MPRRTDSPPARRARSRGVLRCRCPMRSFGFLQLRQAQLRRVVTAGASISVRCWRAAGDLAPTIMFIARPHQGVNSFAKRTTHEDVLLVEWIRSGQLLDLHPAPP